MEFKGRVIVVCPPKSGQKKDGGTWVNQEYVIENNESKYPKKMCFTIMGQDKMDQAAIKIGEDLTVQFDIDARQWQDRWFNSIVAWKVEKNGSVSQTANAQQAPPVEASDAPDDLPF